MKLIKGLIASALIAMTLLTAPTYAAPKPLSKMAAAATTHRKGGYVHAHTYTKKNGTVVNVGGHYRKATEVKKPGVVAAAPVATTHRKGGYVHAHTFTKKNGTVVHVSGHYRKATTVKLPGNHKM